MSQKGLSLAIVGAHWGSLGLSCGAVPFEAPHMELNAGLEVGTAVDKAALSIRLL